MTPYGRNWLRYDRFPETKPFCGPILTHHGSCGNFTRIAYGRIQLFTPLQLVPYRPGTKKVAGNTATTKQCPSTSCHIPYMFSGNRWTPSNLLYTYITSRWVHGPHYSQLQVWKASPNCIIIYNTCVRVQVLIQALPAQIFLNRMLTYLNKHLRLK